jgi:hypothetical protein
MSSSSISNTIMGSLTPAYGEQAHFISREAETATSLITDYVGSKSKQVEDPLYSIFSQSSSPSKFSEKCISKIKETDTVIFKIFDEKLLRTGRTPQNTCKDIVLQKYLITTSDGDVLIDTSCYPFKGGLNLSAKNLKIILMAQTPLIPLVGRVSQRLLNYIIQGSPESNFDCFNFIECLIGQDMHDSNTKWKVVESRKPPYASFLIGDFIVIGTGKEKFKDVHYAFALGSEYFLSINGEQGNLDVMTYSNMMNMWDADTAHRIEPKKI